MFALSLGALVATAVPTVAPVAPKPAIAAAPTRPSMADAFKMFDTIFPPQPAPDPLRMPQAHVTALALLPPDAMGEAVGEMMGGMVDRFLNLRETDLPMSAKAGAKKAPDMRSMRETMHAKDPHFDERMRLIRGAATVEFKRFAAVLEPRLRDGIARAVARRFDQRQLGEINTFLATDSGRALGRQFLGIWFDSDLMRSSIAAMPELVALVPQSMARIEAATAHLPKPPKPAPPRPPARRPRAK